MVLPEISRWSSSHWNEEWRVIHIGLHRLPGPGHTAAGSLSAAAVEGQAETPITRVSAPVCSQNEFPAVEKLLAPPPPQIRAEL